jgi:hypothetical protein
MSSGAAKGTAETYFGKPFMYTVEQAEKDKQEFLVMATELEKNGQHVEAGLYRVQAGNCKTMIGRTKAHKPNLGPYSDENPPHCRDCGKPKEQWERIDEECIPTDNRRW